MTFSRFHHFQVRFEFKTDNRSFMVCIEVPPQELLFPEPISTADFQRVIKVGQLNRETIEFQVGKESVMMRYVYVTYSFRGRL